ncbi:unnamed protein product [Symbiodinium sp. KB8]|nr:unnamed protein product [Symbiodinium sp. KB8]
MNPEREQAGQWQRALQLFHDISHAKLPPYVISYNATISACEKGRQWQLALSLFGSIAAAGLVPDLISHNAAISACEKAGKWQMALQLFASISHRSHSPDVISYSAAISACEKSSAWQMALQMFASMSQADLKPNVISYNATISSCEKGGKWPLALQLFDSMPSAKLAPNVVSYNATISSCEKGSQWELAVHLFDGLLASGLSPQIISYSAAISCCEKAGQWLPALQLFNSILRSGLSPDLICYSTTISSCTKGSQWLLAFQLFHSMQGIHNLAPDVISYNAVLSSCEKAGLWEAAVGLFDAMCQAEVSPDVISYTETISACEKGRQWPLAMALFKSMNESKRAASVSPERRRRPSPPQRSSGKGLSPPRLPGCGHILGIASAQRKASRMVYQSSPKTSETSSRLGRGEFLQFLGISSVAAILTVGSLRSRVRAPVPGHPNLLLSSFSCGTTPLRNPTYLGGGVQAEVFSADTASSGQAVVKLSRANTDYAMHSLEHERRVLEILNDAKVPNIERCIGFGEVSTTAGPRQGMVLMPCLPGRNISVKSGCGIPKLLESQEKDRMERFMATAVRILEAGVAGVDVQVLQSPSSLGISVEGPPTTCPEYERRYRSARDAVVGFATEVFLMVPKRSHEHAVQALAGELRELSEERLRGVGKTFQDVWAKLPWKVGGLETKRLETAARSAVGEVAALLLDDGQARGQLVPIEGLAAAIAADLPLPPLRWLDVGFLPAVHEYAVSHLQRHDLYSEAGHNWRYNFGPRLGRGSFGEAWRAVTLDGSMKEVVLKRLFVEKGEHVRRSGEREIYFGTLLQNRHHIASCISLIFNFEIPQYPNHQPQLLSGESPQVLRLNGEEVATAALDAAADVRALKHAIEEIDGTPERLQQLVWKDQPLDDSLQAPALAAQLKGSASVILVKKDPGFRNISFATFENMDLVQTEDAEAQKHMGQYGSKYRPQHHFFWAVHEGNVLAIGGLLRLPGVDVNGEMLPTDFDDAKRQHEWPYRSFDGRYQDRALHLAVRCRDEASVALLLNGRADPSLRNDSQETPMDIAMGKGTRWKMAFMRPRDFGGSPERILELLRGASER